MRHGSGHRPRAAAHHVLLFVRKPAGLSGAAHGPGKVLPFQRQSGEARRVSPGLSWALVALGVVVLGAALLFGLREVIGAHFGAWFGV